MQRIYQRGGNVAKSKFDPSLLKPIDESNSQFNSAQLKPVEDEEDAGAYLDDLPQPEGFFHKLPRNILAGLANLGHSTINFPHDVVQGAENIGEGLGNLIKKKFPFSQGTQDLLDKAPKSHKLSDYIPYQKEHDFAQMLGQEGEGTLMDKLIQKGIEYAPEITGGTALLRGGIRRLKGTHQLDAVEQAIKERGLSNFNYSPGTAEEARRYLPKSHDATNEMVAASESGNYPASFSMQSQIGKHQRDLARSPLASERLRAPRVGELKQNMLGELGDILRSSGMHKEADMLKTGINNYRQYVKVKDAVIPVLKKLGIPVTILSALGFGYKKLKQGLFD